RQSSTTSTQQDSKIMTTSKLDENEFKNANLAPLLATSSSPVLMSSRREAATLILHDQSLNTVSDNNSSTIYGSETVRKSPARASVSAASDKAKKPKAQGDALRVNMFIIAVLRRQLHPKAFEIYCVAAFGAGILTTLPPQFMGVIGYSIYFGCWYVYKDPRPYIWGFYYGPQLVVSVTNVLMAICIRVSLSTHFRSLYGSSNRRESTEQDSVEKSTASKSTQVETSALSGLHQNSKSMKDLETSTSIIIATSKFDETTSGSYPGQTTSSKPRRESALPEPGSGPNTVVGTLTSGSSTRFSLSVTGGKQKKSKPQGDAL
ncbi:hypothetical protein HDU76_009117, partial [Blyttiomyces sp. JEL0837]